MMTEQPAPQPVTVVIGGSAREQLEITVLGRMHPGTTDYWDGNWLLSPIHLSVGGFEATVGAAGLRAEELRGLRQGLVRLYETLKGRAELQSMEGWLDLIWQGDELGHITLGGTISDRPGSSNTLSFELELDQTYLPGIIASLDQIDAQFPILGDANS